MSDLINKFIHQKLKIIKLDEKGNKTSDEFQVMFNPTHYQEKFGVEVVSKTHVDGNESLTYKQLQDQTLEFELLFDESYVSEYAWRRKIKKKNFDTVVEQIENFKKVTGYPLEDSTKPNDLKLEWGGNTFRGYDFFLQSISLNYTCFNRSGNPIRAKANVIFRRNPDDNSASNKKKSASQNQELFSNITLTFG
jgi:hypothetical protein